jgi:tetratricopeptide (TPR) repeat protein
LDCDFPRAVEQAREGVDIGRALGDVDIESLALNYLGIALVAQGDVDDGVAAHDEAAAAVVSGEATPLVGGLVYCGLIWTCRNRGDWRRAAEWSDIFIRWCGERSTGLYVGSCRMHHAEVLHHRGELEAAEREIAEAAEMLVERAPYARGDTFRVLGDLRLAQGDLDGAEEAYRRAHSAGGSPQPGLARVLVARGRPEAAVRGLQRVLDEGNWIDWQRRPVLLSAMVEVAVAADQCDRARDALAQLESNPELAGTPWLQACVSQARAVLRHKEGDRAAAIAELRTAIGSWQHSGACLPVFHARIRLAWILAEDEDPDAAELELDAAALQLDGLDVPRLRESLERARHHIARD